MVHPPRDGTILVILEIERPEYDISHRSLVTNSLAKSAVSSRLLVRLVGLQASLDRGRSAATIIMSMPIT